ncbi:MAG: hypothetical protein WBA45_11520 [Microthrixaceae bacterium]
MIAKALLLTEILLSGEAQKMESARQEYQSASHIQWRESGWKILMPTVSTVTTVQPQRESCYRGFVDWNSSTVTIDTFSTPG